MPELPEVEVTRRGIEPHLAGRVITGATVRNSALRWPVPRGLAMTLRGLRIEAVKRRAKYLLLDCGSGHLILHLGMSGSLRITNAGEQATRHDHFDLELGDTVLRLRDPRRFGAVLWEPGDPAQHKLLRELGPEPFDPAFDAAWLYRRTRGRTAAVKNLLMDSHIVCGVGNIYANESLFRAGIRPSRAAGRISLARCRQLVDEVRATLSDAIEAGGSTLRDFVHADGSHGHFQQQYFVYAREGEPCRRCTTPIKALRIGQRSAFYCPRCQK